MRSKHNQMGQFATGCPPFDKEVYGPIWEEAQTASGHVKGDNEPSSTRRT